MARILDNHDHRTRESVPRGREHGGQPVDHVRGARVVEPKENHPPGSVPREGREISEVEVEREDDPLFRERLGEEMFVRRSVKPFLAEVDRVVPLATEPLHHTHVHAHVGEESHASNLRASDFLAGQPGSVLQGLLDVLRLEVGVALQDVGHRRVVGDLADDH